MNIAHYNKYVHSNGIQEIEHEFQEIERNSSFNSSEISNVNQALSNNSNQSLNSQSNWDSNNSPSPAILASSISIQPNGASPVGCAAPYIFPNPTPYFTTYVPSMPPGTLPTLVPHPLTSLSNQNNLKDIKPMTLNSSINTSSVHKNTKIPTSASNCDNRNTFYMQNHYPGVSIRYNYYYYFILFC